MTHSAQSATPWHVADSMHPRTNWYCIQTRRYKESWVAQQLGGACEEVYLPLLRQRRRIRRQFRWVIEPVFPNYLFARFPIAERFEAVRYLLGVVNVLGTASGPTVVDETIIALLRKHSLNGYVEAQAAPFASGEELEIIAGPFQGLTALFQQELRAGERVAVLLEMLSSRVRVELPWEYVQQKSVTRGLPLVL
jgi:transcriptional antiterminator RfaH